MTRRRARADDGAATVTALGLVALLLFVTMVAVGTVALVLGHRRSQAAADLAALAAAGAAQRGDDACGAARMIARRHHARVTDCVVRGDVVSVVTVVTVPPGLGGAALPARARAGPLLPRDAGQQQVE